MSPTPKHRSVESPKHHHFHWNPETPRHHVKKFLKLLAFVFVAHYLVHFGWYAFEELVHQLGIPDPKELGKSLAKQTFVPVVIVVLAASSFLSHLME